MRCTLWRLFAALLLMLTGALCLAHAQNLTNEDLHPNAHFGPIGRAVGRAGRRRQAGKARPYVVLFRGRFVDRHCFVHHLRTEP